MVEGVGFGIQGLGFGVSGFGGLRFVFCVLWFRVWGLGLMV